MAGPVESYVDSAANGSLIAAASALMAGGGVEDAAGAIEAGVPRAAHMGRQAFAAVPGRGLASSRLLVLDPGALRPLAPGAGGGCGRAPLRRDPPPVVLP